MNGDVLPESVAAHPLLALYVGGVVMSVMMLACLWITHPQMMRTAVDQAMTLGRLSRPVVMALMLIGYSVGWPFSLPVVIALVRRIWR